jgi:hypothetical protein
MMNAKHFFNRYTKNRSSHHKTTKLARVTT